MHYGLPENPWCAVLSQVGQIDGVLAGGAAAEGSRNARCAWPDLLFTVGDVLGIKRGADLVG